MPGTSSVGSGLIDWLDAERGPILNFLDDFFLPLPDGRAFCCLFDPDTTNKSIFFATGFSGATFKMRYVLLACLCSYSM